MILLFVFAVAFLNFYSLKKPLSMMIKGFPLKSESYEIIGLCMEVQNTLGYGFSEVIYKDALEL